LRSRARADGSPIATGLLPWNAATAVSPHGLASKAAIDIMSAGGNAVDAAIAADAVLGVVLPDTCGPGGDLFALVHTPGMGAPAALNASGRAGRGVDPSVMRRRGLTALPPHDPWTVTVPGCVDGWEALVQRFGRLSLAEMLAPAIAHALDGFPVSTELADSLRDAHRAIGGRPSAADLYPDRTPPRVGAILRRPLLGRTLIQLSAGGRDAFYSGEPGEGITAATDGAVTSDDLERVQADWVEPIGLDVMGSHVWTMPPNSQGYLTPAALWIFQSLDPPRDPETPEYQHLLVEAYRSVAWERDNVVSDSATAPQPPELLLSRQRLTERAARIDPQRTVEWPAPAMPPGGTAYLCTRDSDGVGVSFVQSNFAAIGSGYSAGASGVWLHNRGAGFNLTVGHPNELAPGRRPLHTLSPTLWTRDGELVMLLGTRGGHQQPQLLIQAAAARLWGDLSPEAALALPRWTIDDFGPGTASSLDAEARMADEAVAGLRRRGHDVRRVDSWRADWGPISLIDLQPDLRGAADPRVSTTAALSDP
jgi:gamma-glutamyltranspeptidase/glutathione hydrolase